MTGSVHGKEKQGESNAQTKTAWNDQSKPTPKGAVASCERASLEGQL